MSNIKRLNGIPFDLDGCKGMTKERLTISYGKGSAHALSQRALDDIWNKLSAELGHTDEPEEVDLHPSHANGEADEIDKEVVKEDFKGEVIKEFDTLIKQSEEATKELKKVKKATSKKKKKKKYS